MTNSLGFLDPEYIEPQFRFVDLFAGIGGMRRGFEAAGGRCVFTSEWDKYAQLTYRANFPDTHSIRGDIREIPTEDVPDHEVLLAGFPCQPFSLAGVSKKNSLGRKHGFECDTQGTLFFEIERLIRHHEPQAILLENVKNLLSHDGGLTWEVIRHKLEVELEYDLHPMVIDARAVLPQHRERIFIVGFKTKQPFSWKELVLPSRAEAPTLRTVLHPEDGSEAPEEPFTDRHGRVNAKYTLSDHLWKYLRDYADKHREKGNGFGYSLFGPGDVARTLSARYHKDGSEILIEQKGRNPRRLTPRECARLMGFDPLLSESPVQPDRFVIPVSDTQAYRQFGNSVAVPLVERIAKLMRKFILVPGDADVAEETLVARRAG